MTAKELRTDGSTMKTEKQFTRLTSDFGPPKKASTNIKLFRIWNPDRYPRYDGIQPSFEEGFIPGAIRFVQTRCIWIYIIFKKLC